MKVVLPLFNRSPPYTSSFLPPNLSMQCSHLKMGSPTGLAGVCSLLPLLRDSLILMVGTVTSNTVPHNLVVGLLITNLLIVTLIMLSPITTHLRVSRLRISLRVGIHPCPHSIPAPLRDSSTFRLENYTPDSSGNSPLIKSSNIPRVKDNMIPRAEGRVPPIVKNITPHRDSTPPRDSTTPGMKNIISVEPNNNSTPHSNTPRVGAVTPRDSTTPEMMITTSLEASTNNTPHSSIPSMAPHRGSKVGDHPGPTPHHRGSWGRERI